ncbi:MAG: hypothetical protein II685_04465, partial [Clostridia bacterium]|nr:hypothetical protein [Clostridia bacterium]
KNSSKDSFDQNHQELCEQLANAEKEVIEDPLLAQQVTYNEENRFFNAQFAVNYLLHKLADYGHVPAFFDYQLLHSIIRKEDIKQRHYSMKTYDSYLAAQIDITDRLKTDGFDSRYEYDGRCFGLKKNLLGYASKRDYYQYLSNLSQSELNKEYYRSKELENEINEALEFTIEKIDNFVNYNFLYPGRAKSPRYSSNARYDMSEALENKVRREELVEQDEEATKKTVEKHLNSLFYLYKDNKQKVTIFKSKSFEDLKNKELLTDITIPDILDIRRSILGESGGLDGCFNRFVSLTNSLGVHVCSWLYHLFGKDKHPHQTITDTAVAKLIIKYNDDGSVSYSDTVKVIQDSFVEILNSMDL